MELPSWILLKFWIQINISIEEWEPIMFCTIITGKNNLFTVIGDFCLTRVVVLKELDILLTVKLLTELGVIRIFGQKQPAL